MRLVGVVMLCAEQGVQATVVDPLWVKPLPREVLRLAAGHVLAATTEDGLRLGGVGAALTQALHDAGIQAPVRTFEVTHGFPRQAPAPSSWPKRA